jgi:hypothetical protein
VWVLLQWLGIITIVPIEPKMAMKGQHTMGKISVDTLPAGTLSPSSGIEKVEGGGQKQFRDAVDEAARVRNPWDEKMVKTRDMPAQQRAAYSKRSRL